MMACVMEMQWQFRLNADESMETLSKAAKVVVSPGRQAFLLNADRLPRLTVLPCLNAGANRPLHMPTVPNFHSSNAVFARSSNRCRITTSPNGRIIAETWMERTSMLCQLVEDYPRTKNARD
jgi:hypothetical protein